MGDWYHDTGAGWFLVMALMMVVAGLTIGWVVVQLARSGDREDTDFRLAREILDERLARGEIDVAEYRERVAAIAGRHSP